MPDGPNHTCEVLGCAALVSHPPRGGPYLCTDHGRAVIRAANDAFRTTLKGGTVLATAGIQAMGDLAVLQVLHRVMTYTDFTPDNDPHEEHDFGCFNHGTDRIYWKIDYYDQHLAVYHDPRTTGCHRVLTVLLASEY